MSMVAIFALNCCGKQIVFGRYQGHEMYPPTVAKCRFGCEAKKDPRGNPERVILKFVEYKGEEFLIPELKATWRKP